MNPPPLAPGWCKSLIRRLSSAQGLWLPLTLTFFIYLPGISAEPCLVDDVEMLAAVSASPIPSPGEVFIPGSVGGGYYRPLLHLSFLWDKVLLSLNTRGMHLENILFHLFNVLLVYLLAASWYHDRPRARILAASLFALHPLATESVNWISGRTDLLAGGFMLPAALLLERWRKKRTLFLLLGMGTAFIFACLSKESAVVFAAGGYYLTLGSRIKEEGDVAVPLPTVCLPVVIAGMILSSLVLLFTANGWLGGGVALLCGMVACRGRLLALLSDGVMAKRVGVALLFLVLSIALLVLVRTYVFATSSSKIAGAVSLLFADTSHTIQLFLGAGAFYVVKFFMPLPLNFAIRDIDPIFSLLGVALVTPACCSLLFPSRQSSLMLVGLLMLTPALLLAFGTIAWTSYAERYVYLSLPFWCLAMAGYMASLAATRSWVTPAMVALFGLMAVVTLQRTIQWRTNVGLLGDTARKSPQFREIKAKYFLALLQNGELKKARAEYGELAKLPELFYDEAPDLNMAALLGEEGDYRGALRMYEQVFRRSRSESKAARQGALRAIDDLLARAGEIDRLELLRKRSGYFPVSDPGKRGE